MAPLNPLKRLRAASDAEGTAADSMPEPAAKRQRCDAPVASFLTSSPAHFPLLTPPPTVLPTPKQKRPVIALKLRIPQHIPDDKEKRQAAARKGAATKWAKEGKLQNPFPDQKEIKKAYDLKLLRHYPAATSSATPAPSSTTPAPSSATTPSTSEANFVKPQIQKSSRVTKLLKSFPKLDIPTPTPETAAARQRRYMDEQVMRVNKRLTGSERATRLAWESFAEPDRPTRQSMMESALLSEDLEKEFHGLPNDLPEWKKNKTSRFRA